MDLVIYLAMLYRYCTLCIVEWGVGDAHL